MQRILTGGFTARSAQGGAWRIDGRSVPAPRLTLRGVRAAAGVPQAPQGALPEEFAALEIAWTPQGRVNLSIRGTAGSTPFAADGGYLHEPLPDLYGVLPLAPFDAEARRFWRRVFAVARIPGGRLLLRLLAHSSRRRR